MMEPVMAEFDSTPDATPVSDSFARFRGRLIALARTRMADRIQQKADPEDVVQSVFRSFCRISSNDGNRPADDAGEEELWNFLAVITVRKCAEYGRFFSKQKRDLDREVAIEGGDESGGSFDPAGQDPTASQAAMLAETLESVMSDLDENERTMLTMRLQGHSLREVSEATGRTERTIRRLMHRIRGRLEQLSGEE